MGNYQGQIATIRLTKKEERERERETRKMLNQQKTTSTNHKHLQRDNAKRKKPTRNFA
jgi:hypothetical protein